MNTDLMLQLATVVGGMAATYAAIRADLATTREKAVQAAKDSEKAHDRLDRHIDDFHTTKGARNG